MTDITGRSIDIHNNPMRQGWCSHFVEEETEAQWLSNPAHSVQGQNCCSGSTTVSLNGSLVLIYCRNLDVRLFPGDLIVCVFSPFLMNWMKLVGLQYMSACTLANLKSHHMENSATLLLCFASESAASSCY